MNLERLEEIKKVARENNVPILQDESLLLIETLLSIKKPKSVLEVGTAVGYSALCFSRYLDKDGVIDTIEINKDMVNLAKENIKYVGAECNINIIEADATEYMKEMRNEEYYDAIFIDAAKGQYMVFLEEAIRLAKPGAVIIADNVLFKGRVLGEYNEHKHRTAVNRLREYIAKINSDTRLKSVVIDIGDGVAISVKK